MFIDDYYIELEKELKDCVFVTEVDLDFSRRTDYVGNIKGVVVFNDESILYVKEFVDVRSEECKLRYSYHYEKEGKLIFRYDNAHDYPKIASSPHHKHIINDQVISVKPIPNLKIIIKEISLHILKQIKFKREK